jgi:hypothetical protein
MTWLVFDTEALARGFVDACRMAGIGRDTRNYLWAAMKESLVTPPESPDPQPGAGQQKERKQPNE